MFVTAYKLLGATGKEMNPYCKEKIIILVTVGARMSNSTIVYAKTLFFLPQETQTLHHTTVFQNWVGMLKFFTPEPSVLNYALCVDPVKYGTHYANCQDTI